VLCAGPKKWRAGRENELNVVFPVIKIIRIANLFLHARRFLFSQE